MTSATSSGEAPRPPNSRGQLTPTQRPSARRACQARPHALRPLADRLAPDALRRLRYALALTFGAEAVIVGAEDSVAAQVRALFAAGATDVWAAPFAVGDDAAASRARTRALLASLARD